MSSTFKFSNFPNSTCSWFTSDQIRNEIKFLMNETTSLQYRCFCDLNSRMKNACGSTRNVWQPVWRATKRALCRLTRSGKKTDFQNSHSYYVHNGQYDFTHIFSNCICRSDLTENSGVCNYQLGLLVHHPFPCAGLCPKPCQWRKSLPSKPKSWLRNVPPSKQIWMTT